MEGMQWKGCVHRIRKCAVDLLSMEDDLIDAEEEDGWELTGSELRLKSTFLYCDLHQVIASAGEDRKKALTLLANKLFYRLEQETPLHLFSDNLCYLVVSVWRKKTKVVGVCVQVSHLISFPVSANGSWMKLSRAEAPLGHTSATATQPMCCRN